MCLRCDGSASRALPYNHARSMLRKYMVPPLCACALKLQVSVN